MLWDGLRAVVCVTVASEVPPKAWFLRGVIVILPAGRSVGMSVKGY
ncbi:hypothetical protein [Thalassospira lucentensis]|nr:hypothetical protein [Thalassospira lucentensis]